MKLGKLRDLRERREQMEWDDPDRIGIEGRNKQDRTMVY